MSAAVISCQASSHTAVELLGPRMSTLFSGPSPFVLCCFRSVKAGSLIHSVLEAQRCQVLCTPGLQGTLTSVIQRGRTWNKLELQTVLNPTTTFYWLWIVEDFSMIPSPCRWLPFPRGTIVPPERTRWSCPSLGPP